jgi:serine/threonine protein kinase
MTFAVGETVGPYQIISPLGEGGMASVYKAYHANLDRYVAIKVMHPAFKEDKTFVSRFEREARVLARLDHPNIVPIFDFAEHEGQPYLVMKYIEGGTLKDRLALHAPSLPETLIVVETVGSALAYAHQQGILHRDIKPSNIIITPDNHYYLSDFGLARLTSAGESTLSQDALLGTPNYISPEQAKGQTDLDGRTDIYSFGIVLYEMIVGRVPFSGTTPYSIVHDHIYTPLPPPSSINPRVTEPLEKFLLKALAKNREDRFPDARAVVADFRQAVGALGSEPVPLAPADSAARTEAWPRATVVSPDRAPSIEPIPTPPTTPIVTAPPPKPAAKRNWWLLGGLALLVLCLGTLGLVALGRLARDNRARGTATALALVTTPVLTQTSTQTPTQKPAPTLTTSSDALVSAQATLAAAPNSVEANWRLGAAYYEAGRFDEAATAYDKAAALAKYRAVFYSTHILNTYASDPLFALTVLNDGLHNAERRFQLELWPLAVPLLQQVTGLANAEPLLISMNRDFPAQPWPLLALAQHYLLFQKLDQAAPLIDQARRDFPDTPLTLFIYGEYLQAKGQTTEALAQFQSVVANPRAGLDLQQAAQKNIDKLKGTVTP